MTDPQNVSDDEQAIALAQKLSDALFATIPDGTNVYVVARAMSSLCVAAIAVNCRNDVNSMIIALSAFQKLVGMDGASAVALLMKGMKS